MKTTLLLLVTALSFSLFYSCDPEQPQEGDVLKSLVGTQWVGENYVEYDGRHQSIEDYEYELTFSFDTVLLKVTNRQGESFSVEGSYSYDPPTFTMDADWGWAASYNKELTIRNNMMTLTLLIFSDVTFDVEFRLPE